MRIVKAFATYIIYREPEEENPPCKNNTAELKLPCTPLLIAWYVFREIKIQTPVFFLDKLKRSVHRNGYILAGW